MTQGSPICLDRVQIQMILISATQKGNKIGIRLKQAFPRLEIVTREQMVEQGLKDITKKAVESHNTIIFVASTGIAVRAIAPWVNDKREDPAVIVIDSEGRYVISLLSGHIGGANNITQEIAAHLGSMPIITTATDQLGIVAPDMISQEYHLIIESMEKCKEISVQLIQGEKVAFIDHDHLIPLPKGYVDANEEAKCRVVVSNQWNVSQADLQLIRKNIVLGIGCRKDVDPTKMRKYILRELEIVNIHPLAVEEIVSIDIKKDEKCILELSKYLQVPFKVYSKEEINQLDYDFQGSDFVESQVGVRGVSEPCVILAGAQVIKKKSKFEGMTLCIGKKEINNG